MARLIGVEIVKDPKFRLKKGRLLMNNPYRKKINRRKHIQLSNSDLSKLKKHKHMSSKDFVIDVVDRTTHGISVFGRRKL